MAIVYEQEAAHVETGAVSQISVTSGDGWSQPSADNLIFAAGGKWYVDSSDLSYTAPSGITNGAEESSTNFRSGLIIGYKVAAGSGEGTITCDDSGTNDNEMSLYVAELSGADTTTPIQDEDVAGQDATTNKSIAAPTVTAANASSLAIGVLVKRTFSAPESISYSDSFVEQNADGEGSSNHDCSLFIADKVVGAGDVDLTCSWSANGNGSCAIVIINEAAVAEEINFDFTKSGQQPYPSRREVVSY